MYIYIYIHVVLCIYVSYMHISLTYMIYVYVLFICIHTKINKYIHKLIYASVCIYYMLYSCGSSRGVLLKQCCSTSHPPKKINRQVWQSWNRWNLSSQTTQLCQARVESQLLSFWGWENSTCNGKS